MRKKIGVCLHSYAVAASGLRTPLSCHPTLTYISPGAGFASTALASVDKKRGVVLTGARAVDEKPALSETGFSMG
jgi:hypothetical protein